MYGVARVMVEDYGVKRSRELRAKYGQAVSEDTVSTNLLALQAEMHKAGAKGGRVIHGPSDDGPMVQKARLAEEARLRESRVH